LRAFSLRDRAADGSWRGQEIYLILEKRDVGLQDLLLMFLHVEALAVFIHLVAV